MTKPFAEYIPEGGWIEYRKAQARKEKVQNAIAVAIVGAIYVVAWVALAYVEGGY